MDNHVPEDCILKLTRDGIGDAPAVTLAPTAKRLDAGRFLCHLSLGLIMGHQRRHLLISRSMR